MAYKTLVWASGFCDNPDGLAARASEWMAKAEDVAQFLKGTPNADEVGFSPDLHSHSGKIAK
jgi:hypothetical protein